MATSNLPFSYYISSFLITTIFILISVQSSSPTQAFSITLHRRSQKEFGRRSLLSFKETHMGSNVTFECSPSGPCVSCQYSEKNDDKYRCSETGYRIPLKCVEVESGSKLEDNRKPQKDRSTMEITHGMMQDRKQLTTSAGHRRLLDDPAKKKGIERAYITYRSCIPAVFEEKLSVFGFEAIMLALLLFSGSVVYIRKKRTIAMAGVGPVRVQTNSRF